MKKNVAAIAALGLLGALSPVFAQGAGPDYSKVEEQLTDLGHNMYAMTGAGGNTTVAVGSDGIIVTDTQFAPVYDKIKAKIKSLSPLPVKYVILTHYHGDHVGGAASFAKDGATLVSHRAIGGADEGAAARRQWPAWRARARRCHPQRDL